MIQRVELATPPFAGHAAAQAAPPWNTVAEWPAQWLSFPEGAAFALYRLTLPGESAGRFHITADERYELHLDGQLLARGPERGDPANWYYESFDLVLPPGPHVLMVRVWALGPRAPWAQMSVRPGLLVAGEGPLGAVISTGSAPWQVRPEHAITPVRPADQCGLTLGSGAAFIFDCATLHPGWRGDDAEGFAPAVAGALPAVADTSVFISPNRQYLRPGTLPPQLRTPIASPRMVYVGHDDTFTDPSTPVAASAGDASLSSILRGERATIPANTTLRAIIDLGEYACHYPTLAFAAGHGATIRLRYAESLWDTPQRKSMTRRDAVAGRVFRGFYDEFIADGRSHREHIPWWRAGRFVQLEIRTADTPLHLDDLTFEATGYDDGDLFQLTTGNSAIDAVAQVALRTLRRCSHETHMDCPYYEQLQYVGDTRLQVLLSFLTTIDPRLAPKALRLFDASRANPSGLTLDSYPGAGKLIPPFALWWICMIWDYAMWRDGEQLAREMLVGAREIADRFMLLVDADDLLLSPRGWNYVDVASGFQYGVPPGGEQGGHSGVLQWQLIYTLTKLAQLEEVFGEATLAAHRRSQVARLLTSAERHYWDESRGLFADDREHRQFSQHAQVLAVLSDLLPAERCRELMAKAVSDTTLVPCNIYFAHYLFEATSRYDGGAYLRSRIGDWAKLVDEGFTTFPEHFGATRSECHAWSAHVLYHILTTLVGLRPATWAAREMILAPNLRPGENVRATLAHGHGPIRLDLSLGDEGVCGEITLPAGVTLRSCPRGVRVKHATAVPR